MRTVVDENGIEYKDFPIARFLCRGKGKNPEVKHRTFSLLPYQLIPYLKYSIPFIIKIYIYRYIHNTKIEEIYEKCTVSNEEEAAAAIEGKTKTEIIESIAKTEDNKLYITPYVFQRLIINSIYKLRLCNYYLDIENVLKSENNKVKQIKIFIIFANEFECHKVINGPIRGSPALSYDYYLEGGSYEQNSLFLFGTPSQHRKCNR